MKSKPVVLDSNVWIGFFNNNDALHKRAVKVIESHRSDTIILTEYVLLEISTLLKLKVGPGVANKIIEILLQTENIELLTSDQYFTDTLRAFLSANDRSLSFVDMSLFVLSKDYEVVTFDKKLLAAIKG